MKKTIDISLGGILFHVEEDAYYKLKKYLQSVRKSLGNTPDAEEVMNEIEARIAELLLEKQAHPQQVINIRNIDEIIAVMGQPEDYEEESEPVQSPTHTRVKKSLFRDLDNSVIGGVAAGLAHYIGLDVTLMRLLFVILFFVTHGSFALIYILLWMVIPKAKTASDKLKMKGESINVDNIAEQITTGEEGGKKKIKIAETVEDTTQEFGNVIIKIIGLLLALITGVLLLGLILSMASLLPFADTNLMIDSMPVFESLNLSFGWLSALILILVGIPIALLFLLGIKMLFPNTKSLNKNVLIVSAVIWFLSLAFVFSKTSALRIQKNEDIKITTAELAWHIPGDTLNLFNPELNLNDDENAVSDNRIYYKYHPSNDDKFHLKIKAFAEGSSKKSARENARKIQFYYAVDSLQNKITFDKMMSYPDDNFIIDRKTYVHLYIPEGKSIKITEDYGGFGDFSNCEPPFVLTNENGSIRCYSNGKKQTREEVINIKGKKVRIKIGEKGVNIQAAEDSAHAAHIQIDENGIRVKAKENEEEVGIEINEKGIKIKNKSDEK